LREQLASFPGFIIGETKIISPDEEQIGVQATPGGVIFAIHLILLCYDFCCQFAKME